MSRFGIVGAAAGLVVGLLISRRVEGRWRLGSLITAGIIGAFLGGYAGIGTFDCFYNN